jgi:hypothetical protein
VVDGVRGDDAARAGRRLLGWWLVVHAVAVALIGTGVRPASTQTPEQVRDALAPPGIVVAEGAADPVAIAAAVTRAREAGFELVVVVNVEDPRPDPDAYALRVRQLGVGDPVLVFGPGGQFGVSSDVLHGTDLTRARDAAAQAASPQAATEAFTDALLTEPEDTVPALVEDLVRIVVIALGVLVVSVVANEALRRNRRRRSTRTRPPLAS